MRRTFAWMVLAALLAASLAAGFLPGASYSKQHRELTNASPSFRFPLGTDDLGRDRLVRLLCATRISLLLAAAAALGALILAVIAGGTAGYLGGRFDRAMVRGIDLMLSLPWLFLLIAARALLPLNASPETSLVVTYFLLSLLGWAAPARVVRAGVRSFHGSDFVLQARAEGCRESRVLLAPHSAQSAAGARGAILDIDPGFHSGGSQPGLPGFERQRAVSHLGQSLAGTAKPADGPAGSVRAGSRGGAGGTLFQAG